MSNYKVGKAVAPGSSAVGWRRVQQSKHRQR